jgi:C4-dicarboxylate transporter DctM subunit
LSSLQIALLFCLGLIALLLSGMRVAICMFTMGLIGLYFWLPVPSLDMAARIIFNSSNSFTLTAIPLFVFMGELLLRSGLNEDAYRAAEVWLAGLPGGLAHANIGSCAVFAAMCGSSAATAATIGTVALPAMKRRGYDAKLSLGSLAAGGTLGILIPPSVTMIVYGALTGESVGKLFMAGVIPGVMLAAAFMLYILIWSIRVPSISPKSVRASSFSASVRKHFLSLVSLLPVAFIIFIVLGTIYLGMATPTEAAAMGAAGSLIVAFAKRRLTLRGLNEAARGTTYTTAMIFLILTGSMVISYIINWLAIPEQLSQIVVETFHTQWLVLPAIYIMYLILGCFLDGFSMMILTVPFVVPIIQGFGLSPLWFGVIVTISIEQAMLTPPVGMNLFILQGVYPDIRWGDLVWGSLPFVAIMMAIILLLQAFPPIVTWLPDMMFAVR